MVEYLKSILAGVCIAIGCIISLLVEDKIIGAVLFSVGLLSILAFKLNLYTGKIGLSKSIKDVIKYASYLFANIIGCMLVFAVIKPTVLYDKIELRMAEVALIKSSETAYELFIFGIFCGMLMLFATKYAHNKILTIFCVTAFIICGFEHSVADSFFLLVANLKWYEYFQKILIIALGNGVGAIITNKIGGDRYEQLLDQIF